MNSIAKSFNSVYNLLSPSKVMALPEGMQTLAARLASFESTKTKGKKRTSTSTKGKKAASDWPLEAPTAEDSLDEWDEGDDPFREHLQFAPECAWAVTMAVERGVILKDDDHDPLAEDFVEMRTATFGGVWPHESKKGWTPKVKKLVDAGWHYFPTPDEEDQTKCAYCSLCVSGWEPKDKPLEEHKRRAPECPFFHLTHLHKKTRPKKSRASKASRMSNISIATWTKEPSMIADENTNLDDSIMSAATDVTTASTATTATTATRKSTRTKKSTAKAAKNKQKQEEVEDTMDYEDIVEEDKPNAAPSPVTGKPKRGRKRSSAVMLEDDEDEVIPPPKKRGARGRSTTARPEPPPAAEPKAEPPLEPMPATDTRSEPEAVLEPEVEPELEAEPVVELEAQPELELEPEPEPEPEPEVEVDAPALSSQQNADIDSKMEDVPAEEEPGTLAMPKRGAKGRNTRGSTASRKASGVRGRKATGPRKVSGRKASSASTVKPDEPGELSQHMDLDDAAIEAQLAADLDRPLSDEEASAPIVEEQAKVEKPARGRRSTAKKPAGRAASKTVQQPKIEPKKLPVMADDSEEDELADTYPTKPVGKAEQLFSNPYEGQVDEVQLSGGESSNSVIETKSKKLTKKQSIASASAPAPKAKRGRPPKKAVPKTEEASTEQPDLQREPESQPESTREEPTGLRFSSSFEEVPSMLDDVEAPARVDAPPAVEAKAAVPKKATKATKANKVTKPVKAPAATKKGKSKKASAVLTGPEEPVEPPKIESPAREPTPDTRPAQRQATPEQEEAAPSPPQSAPGAFPSPTPSPQLSPSSNAENEPPSSRPSHTRPPLAALTPNKHMQRVPLGSVGPSTPVHSESRIYEDADADATTTPQWALQSGFPWRPVDIENVFLPSPDGKEKRWFGAKSSDENETATARRENSAPLSASKDIKESRKKKSAAMSAAERARQDKLKQMAGVLTEVEKDMTVEQWIRNNAERGELKLREQCERVVSRFEGEGIRAMKALEGLVVEEWA